MTKIFLTFLSISLVTFTAHAEMTERYARCREHGHPKYGSKISVLQKSKSNKIVLVYIANDDLITAYEGTIVNTKKGAVMTLDARLAGGDTAAATPAEKIVVKEYSEMSQSFVYDHTRFECGD
jgi:hypothetical protein